MGKPDGDLDERDWLKAELADLVDEDIQLAALIHERSDFGIGLAGA